MFTVTFAYNANDPAQKIYADLTDTARKACRSLYGARLPRRRPAARLHQNVVESALKAMVRTDVASLHYDRNA